jgi:hypothetical protein
MGTFRKPLIISHSSRLRVRLEVLGERGTACDSNGIKIGNSVKGIFALAPLHFLK